MEWKYVKELKNYDNVNEFEKITNIKLPQDYIELIKKYNGARPSLKLFKTVSGVEHVVKAILSYNKEDRENIFKTYDWIKEQLPINFVPIASDPAGNYICYNKDFELYYWEHETTNVEKIADSFSDFINNLYL